MPALKRVLTNWKHQIISAVAEWQKKEEARKSREGGYKGRHIGTLRCTSSLSNLHMCELTSLCMAAKMEAGCFCSHVLILLNEN